MGAHMDRMVKFNRTAVDNQAERIAKKLEEMAEEIRVQTVRNLDDPEKLVRDVLHIVTWGLANANLDKLQQAVMDFREMEAAATKIASESSEAYQE